jgi:maltose-binding protein MalE
LYTQGLFLNPASAPHQQELAWLLADHVTAAESGTVLARSAGLLPANRNADLGHDADLRAFARQAATAQAMPHGAVMDHIWRYGGDMLVRATAGVEDPAAIVTETTTLINEATGR